MAQVQHLSELPPNREEQQNARTSPNESVGVFRDAACDGCTQVTFNPLVLTCELNTSRPQSELRVLPLTASKGIGSLNPNVEGLKQG